MFVYRKWNGLLKVGGWGAGQMMTYSFNSLGKQIRYAFDRMIIIVNVIYIKIPILWSNGAESVPEG